MLILFDIDMTLIRSDGAGMAAMELAGREAFGEAVSAQGIEFGGKLDPVIMAAMLTAAGVEASAENMRVFRDGYHRHLSARSTESGWARALPGVMGLLERLESAQPRPVLGLLTGNFEETGRIKLAAAGIDADRFAVRVWGDDSPHEVPARDHLPPVGMSRASELVGREVAASEVTIVGDTVHDVACARAHGCRVLAVATGWTSADELRRAGADRVVEDLTGTDDVTGWLMKARAAVD